MRPLFALVAAGLGLVVVATPAGTQDGEKPLRAGQDLSIELTADTAVWSTRTQVEFQVVFGNGANRVFRLFEETSFKGSELKIVDAQGREIALEGGYATWSPKAGVFTGRTVLLKPGERWRMSLHAYLDGQRRLVFSDDVAREVTAETRERLDVPPEIPDRYVGAGRIFPLGRAGKYSLAFHYERSKADRQWRVAADAPAEASTEDIWIGAIDSNRLEIEVK